MYVATVRPDASGPCVRGRFDAPAPAAAPPRSLGKKRAEWVEDEERNEAGWAGVGATGVVALAVEAEEEEEEEDLWMSKMLDTTAVKPHLITEMNRVLGREERGERGKIGGEWVIHTVGRGVGLGEGEWRGADHEGSRLRDGGEILSLTLPGGRMQRALGAASASNTK